MPYPHGVITVEENAFEHFYQSANHHDALRKASKTKINRQ
tara:strand:+ start:189 stop:308 length:120 start_codon:yes stop_codon:yes gene_type:complete